MEKIKIAIIGLTGQSIFMNCPLLKKIIIQKQNKYFAMVFIIS